MPGNESGVKLCCTASTMNQIFIAEGDSGNAANRTGNLLSLESKYSTAKRCKHKANLIKLSCAIDSGV